MEIKFDKEVSVDTTGMLGKYVYVDGKPYIVEQGIICIDGSGVKGVILKEIEEPKPIPQTKEVEWVNGLPPVGVECEWIGGGLNHGDWGLVVVHAYHNDFAWIEKLRDNSMHTVGNPAHFRKPETEAERIEREELEAAYDLYVSWNNALGHDAIRHISTFKYDDNYALFRFFIAKQKNLL